MNTRSGLVKRNKFLTKMKPTVFVALSGGVDSAVTAIKMKNRFSSVRGIFLDFFGKEDYILRTKKIAKKIGIETEVINLQKEFKNEVVDYYVRSYQNGLTPNPCVICNRKIKFKYLLREIKKRGGKFIATGHYAKIKQIDENYYLYRAKSKRQDQSYFLWQLKRQWLGEILFPLSNLNKKQVTNFARQKGILEYCQQPSQDFCFLNQTKNDQSIYAQQFLSFSQWNLFEVETDRWLGNCRGNFFTLGQRRRFGLGGGPWYLVKINNQQKKLFLTKDKQKLFIQKLLVHRLNWLINPPTDFPINIRVKIRSTARLISAKVKMVDYDLLEIKLSKPQIIAPPGQSAVFYQKEMLIGGGIIKNLN